MDVGWLRLMLPYGWDVVLAGMLNDGLSWAIIPRGMSTISASAIAENIQDGKKIQSTTKTPVNIGSDISVAQKKKVQWLYHRGPGI